ncbi:MAG TPA: Wzz/FepE/Etk N-terminal domain-containing protein, partial [Terriglobales bacterium]|nr:Wzz/FepE/Etk N-terminal domain-containing protein [Terriglobales bacterium]
MRIKEELRHVPHTVTLEDLGLLLRRHAGGVLLVFAATVLGAYVTLQFLTERYETSASILVKVGRENTETPLTVQNGGFLATGVRKEEINSELELLTSRSLVEQA